IARIGRVGRLQPTGREGLGRQMRCVGEHRAASSAQRGANGNLRRARTHSPIPAPGGFLKISSRHWPESSAKFPAFSFATGSMKSIHSRHSAKALTAAALLIPALAHAHPGHSHAAGWVEGAAHPLLGLDHILAMVAVGLWATQIGGRAKWL